MQSAGAALCETLQWVSAALPVCLVKNNSGWPSDTSVLQKELWAPIPQGLHKHKCFFGACYHSKLRNELSCRSGYRAEMGFLWEHRCAQALLWLWFCESLLPHWWERAGFDKNGNACLWVERLFHLWLYLFCCSLSWAAAAWVLWDRRFVDLAFFQH